MMSAVPKIIPELIDYPDTDGEPMAESDFQRDYLTYLVESLKIHFQDQSQVYVSGNLLIYYKPGNSKVSISPDVFVVFGVSNQSRRIYQTWVEGKGPDWVMEITSSSTRTQDEKIKPGLYQKLGVKEYFQYDPTGDYLTPALRGRHLVGQSYQDLPVWSQADGTSILCSEVLDLQFHLIAGQLRVFNPATQRYLLNHSETLKAYHQESERAELESERAELEKQRARKALVQVAQEKQLTRKALVQVAQEKQLTRKALRQATQEKQRAEQEQQRAEKLAAQLRALGIDPDQLK